ncbi:MAG: hypothetical protein C4516_04315 [Oxalobacter sp.]|nr:MAG: hypothetical protein C4516_04315 [Oxalobacter sp.]
MAKEIIFWSKSALVAVAVSFAAHYFGALDKLAAGDLRAAAGVLAQIGATMLGFVLAALAILATMSNSKLVRNMGRTGHYQVLLQRMFVCVGAFGLVTMAGVTVIFLPVVTGVCAYVLSGFSLLSIVLLVDVSRKFWKVLHHFNPE